MILGKSVLGIIPARYGSKRLRLKNIRLVNNKPLLAWTILSAKKSQYLDKIILSTESKKIVKIAKRYGCQVPFVRKKNLSSDTANSIEVILYTLKRLKKHFDYVMLLQPTSPLRLSSDIDGALKKIIKSKANSLVSVYKSKKPNKFLVRINNCGFVERVKKKQLLKKSGRYNYYLNGMIYLVRFDFILKNKSFFSKNTIPFNIPEKRSIDVDTEKDFKKLKKIFKR